MKDKKNCKHLNFHAHCEVARLEDTGKFMLDLRVRCQDCRQPFQFKGLPPGLNMNGASMSVDGLTAQLAIVPKGSEATPFDQMVGEAMAKAGGQLN